MVVTIDAEAGGAVCGGAGGEEVASIDEAFHRPRPLQSNGRNGRLVGRGGCPEGWRERRAGPSAHTGGLGVRMVAVLACGSACAARS